MAVAFTRLSRWLWSGKHQEPRVSHGSSLNSGPDAELKETDIFESSIGHGKKMASASKRVNKKYASFEERKAVRDYDAVIVPSDGGCSSESESESDSDWSIGWLEPHGHNFDSDNESDDSFAVLVPCYGRGHGETKGSSKDKFKPVVKGPDIYAAENRSMEQWLSSLRNS
ncbi:Homeodomain superfamily protein [Heracleum sosnowskyi]|uniref:Homeodomain superfamily protein n=1 Tax=Heracleum sosnowskyi TaxID=360622 RepID=A0AAD8HI47_9APIA|nr:Homeodomain superfamily protein [Heracleum sosnowskyi]